MQLSSLPGQKNKHSNKITVVIRSCKVIGEKPRREFADKLAQFLIGDAKQTQKRVCNYSFLVIVQVFSQQLALKKNLINAGRRIKRPNRNKKIGLVKRFFKETDMIVRQLEIARFKHIKQMSGDENYLFYVDYWQPFAPGGDIFQRFLVALKPVDFVFSKRKTQT